MKKPDSVMKNADDAYESMINSLLLPSDPDERERFVFNLGYLAGRDAVLTKLSQTTNFPTQ